MVANRVATRGVDYLAQSWQQNIEMLGAVVKLQWMDPYAYEVAGRRTTRRVDPHRSDLTLSLFSASPNLFRLDLP